jgi:hypothetical protein
VVLETGPTVPVWQVGFDSLSAEISGSLTVDTTTIPFIPDLVTECERRRLQ